MKKIKFLIILAFAARAAAFFILKLNTTDNPLFYVSESDIIALNILSGKGYVYPLYYTTYYFYAYPFYVYFLAIIHSITNKNYLIIEMLQIAIAAFSVVPLILIANKIFNKKTALISGLLFCLHPGLIVFTLMISEITLFICFMLLIIYLMVCSEIKTNNLIAIGTLMGLGLLLRPTIIFLIPAFFIYLIVKKKSMKKIFLSLFTIALLAMIIISPWIYRGYKIYNRFIFITLSNGHTFWKGNNPGATGAGLTKEGQSILVTTASEDSKKKLFSLNEIEQYQFFKDRAIEYIKAHPFVFLKNTGKKFVYFWSFSPQTGIIYPALWSVAYKVLYCFLALFFVIGLYFIKKNKDYLNMPVIIFLFSFFIIISFFQSLYYVDTRHRFMIEPLLMIISGYGIANVFLEKKDYKSGLPVS